MGIAVGKTYRDLKSVRKFVERVQNGTTILLLNPLSSSGDVIAFHAAERTGKTVQFVTDTERTTLSKIQTRVDFVKQLDRLVVFGDKSKKMEHLSNLANANKVELVEFREV